jgi:ABC-type oligopeptide transport system substrate-binding subunit
VPPIEVYVSGYSGAESLRDSLRESRGLTIDGIGVPWPSIAAGLAHQRYAAFELYWGADYPDPESMLRMLFGTGTADNYTGYTNPAFDALLDQAAREQDVAARAGLYSAAQQMLIDDAVILPVYYDVAYWLIKPRVKGVEFTPLGLLRLESIWMEH